MMAAWRYQHRVDGVILAQVPIPNSALCYLRENDIPSVLLDRLVSRDFDQISVENMGAMQTRSSKVETPRGRSLPLVFGMNARLISGRATEFIGAWHLLLNNTNIFLRLPQIIIG
jgi:hypothetical protein